MTGIDDQTNSDGRGASFWLSLSVAPLLPVAAYAWGWNISSGMAILLSTSLFLAILLKGHIGRIPSTEIRVSPVAVVVFWTILNLGALGGSLVAAAAALSGLSSYSDRGTSWLRSSLNEIARAALAGFAFDTALDLFRFGVSVPDNPLVPTDILAAAVFMLAAYQIASVLFERFPWTRSENVIQNSIGAVRRFTGQALAAAASVILFAAFSEFGQAFVLVVVPLTVLGHAGIRLHLRRLDQKVRQIADASRLHLATVEALATAIDARDQVGMGHVRRTQIYALGIGAALGLADAELDALRAGALLHDIGKLAVPEHILNKPGRLTSAELEKTKVHATVGASILDKVGFPYPVVPTVRHHHEAWDGNGYPDGLSGERIPITARILSVADTYDALRGPRPFRAAVSREDACNFLRSRAGTQFDPHVVNTFLRDLRQLESELEIHGLGYEGEVPVSDTPMSATADYVAQIKRANQEVFSLYEMARDFGASLDLQTTLELLTRKISEFVPYDTCLVYLLGEDGANATAAYVEGRNSGVLADKRVVVGEGATGYVLKKRKPVENVDPSLDFAFSHAEICDHYVGMASVPLLADDKLLGAISVFSGKLAVYEEEHLRLLETISRIAGDAIAKSIRQAETEVHAQTDPLTGLPNARGLQIQFEKELGRARRSGDPMQLLMLDLDGFKAVNDTFGHKAGDTLLREVGGIIQAELRDYDFLARYGGDEFVALVPETDSSDVIELCARIETAVASYALSVDGETASVGVSVGSACFPAQGESFEQLLIAADKAMYRTKAFHKQRRVRLGDGTNTPAAKMDEVIETYATDGPPISDVQARPITSENELVVELDESHIVVVNTVN
ncbi:MAG: diguanylate cyclase [Acidobacteria bacterium]|nr:diguanylate cyclase [Acidobacteriota bacterium]